MKGGGRQSGPPHLKTHSRPNAPTVKDEEEEITSTGTEWIIEGDFTAAELEKSYWVDVIAEELDVNPTAVNAKINYEILGGEDATYEESRQAAMAYIKDNNWDGEEV
jgi:hypothetical protein